MLPAIKLLRARKHLNERLSSIKAQTSLKIKQRTKMRVTSHYIPPLFESLPSPGKTLAPKSATQGITHIAPDKSSYLSSLLTSLLLYVNGSTSGQVLKEKRLPSVVVWVGTKSIKITQKHVTI
jgi:hypothetical protein